MTVVKASSRMGTGLADHLLNAATNEHVLVSRMEGVAARDLHGAIEDMEAFAVGTKATRPLRHVMLNPASNWSEAQWDRAWDSYEREFGLEGRAFAEVTHLKQGRLHKHRVYARTDPATGEVARFGHDYQRHEKLARALEFDAGEKLTIGRFNRRVAEALEAEGLAEVAAWMNEGAALTAERPVAGANVAEQRQVARSGVALVDVRQAVWDAWSKADDAKALRASMEAAGLKLAAGDKPGAILVVDGVGETHELRRALNAHRKAAGLGAPLKAAEVAARIKALGALPSVDQAKAAQSERIGAAVDRLAVRNATVAAKPLDQALEAAKTAEKQSEQTEVTHAEPDRRTPGLLPRLPVDRIEAPNVGPNERNEPPRDGARSPGDRAGLDAGDGRHRGADQAAGGREQHSDRADHQPVASGGAGAANQRRADERSRRDAENEATRRRELVFVRVDAGAERLRRVAGDRRERYQRNRVRHREPMGNSPTADARRDHEKAPLTIAELQTRANTATGYARAEALEAAHARAAQFEKIVAAQAHNLAAEEALVKTLADRRIAGRNASTALTTTLSSVYADPDAASKAWMALKRAEKTSRAAKQVERDPATLGELRGRSYLFGLVDGRERREAKAAARALPAVAVAHGRAWGAFYGPKPGLEAELARIERDPSVIEAHKARAELMGTDSVWLKSQAIAARKAAEVAEVRELAAAANVAPDQRGKRLAPAWPGVDAAEKARREALFAKHPGEAKAATLERYRVQSPAEAKQWERWTAKLSRGFGLGR